jgi:hypothetical protein
MVSSSSPARGDVLEVSGKAAALAAVLLPAVGVLVRFIAFRFDNAIPNEVAWSASLSQLVATALLSLLFSVGFFILYAITKRYAPVLYAKQRMKVLQHVPDQLKEEHDKELEAIKREGQQFAEAAKARYLSWANRLAQFQEESRMELDGLQRELEQFKDAGEVPPSFANRLAQLQEKHWKEHETIQREGEQISDATKAPFPFANRLDAFQKKWDERVKKVQEELKEIDTLTSGSVEAGSVEDWWDRLLSRAAFGYIGDHQWLVRYGSFLPIVLFLPGWPAPLFAAANQTIFVLMLERAARRTGQLSLSKVWPAVITALLISALSGGLLGILPGVSTGSYQFNSQVALSIRPGQYISLGQANNMAYLQSCDPSKREVVRIHEDDILVTTFDSSTSKLPPSLWQVIVRHQSTSLGFQPRC